MNLQTTAGASALLMTLNFTTCRCYRSFAFQDEFTGQVGDGVISVSSDFRAKTPHLSFNWRGRKQLGSCNLEQEKKKKEKCAWNDALGCFHSMTSVSETYSRKWHTQIF